MRRGRKFKPLRPYLRRGWRYWPGWYVLFWAILVIVTVVTLAMCNGVRL